MASTYNPLKGFLNGIRVLQYTDEKGDYAGKLLAGLGADVVMVEPPGGSPSRRLGPFYHDEPGIENSLFHWHYNVGKRGMVLDITESTGRDQFRQLAALSDVVLESMRPGYLAGLGLGYEQLKRANPGLVMAAITPFGQSGPWRDLKASDLVQLALGGEMNYTRYPPQADGTFDTPPIAGQMWQAYHLTGDHAAHAILAALIFRMTSGQGQFIDVPIHQVCSVTTEHDLPTYVYAKGAVARFGFRFIRSKDGRFVLAGFGDGNGAGFAGLLRLLKELGGADDLEDPKYQEQAYRATPDVVRHIAQVTERAVGAMTMEEAWHKGQQARMLWAAIRKPEENLVDRHWAARSTFAEIEHPELERSFTYPVARWESAEAPWQAGPRAPRVGEHTAEVLREAARGVKETLKPVDLRPAVAYVNRSGRKLPLEGVRILDLTWLLASAGGPKILSSFGAECIRIEWKGRFDTVRFRPAMSPPAPAGSPPSVNRSGYFNDTNAGRMGISLNMNSPKGKEIFRQLVGISDVVVEGFRPGQMEKWGFGYESLKKIKSDIVYVQQSGFGEKGPYEGYGSVGPVANGIAGLTDMSGLPDPYPPLGWLYSFMDFGGAYNCALALLSGIYYKRMTGKGIYIDSSQIEPGVYYTGTAILDYQVNGREYSRTGNRSPSAPAAPHGAYRCKGPQSIGAAGAERWVAIACFTDDEWKGLCKAMGDPAWTRDPRFATLSGRCQSQDALDAYVNKWTESFDAYALMDLLQSAGVPAGVCQTAQERVERDPQLKHLGWLTELPHSELGTYPIKTFPAHLSLTPAYQGGPIGRAAPCYGEDNLYVYGSLLSKSEEEIKLLQAGDVI